MELAVVILTVYDPSIAPVWFKSTPRVLIQNLPRPYHIWRTFCTDEYHVIGGRNYVYHCLVILRKLLLYIT